MTSRAADDIKQMSEISPLLEDIHNLRYAKLLSKVKDLDTEMPVKTQIANITSEELVGIRQMYANALNISRSLDKPTSAN